MRSFGHFGCRRILISLLFVFAHRHRPRVRVYRFCARSDIISALPRIRVRRALRTFNGVFKFIVQVRIRSPRLPRPSSSSSSSFLVASSYSFLFFLFRLLLRGGDNTVSRVRFHVQFVLGVPQHVTVVVLITGIRGGCIHRLLCHLCSFQLRARRAFVPVRWERHVFSLRHFDGSGDIKRRGAFHTVGRFRSRLIWWECKKQTIAKEPEERWRGG